jgi:hypothetical protein
MTTEKTARIMQQWEETGKLVQMRQIVAMLSRVNNKTDFVLTLQRLETRLDNMERGY